MKLFAALVFLCMSFHQRIFAYNIDSLKTQLTLSKDTSLVNTLICLAFEYEINDQKTGLDYAQKALTLSKEINYTKGIAKSHYHMGICYLNSQQFDKAEAELLISLSMFIKLHLKQEESNVYSYLGSCALYKADYPKSIAYYLKRLSIEEELQNKPGLMITYNSLGSVYAYANDLDKSIEYFMKCVALMEKSNPSGAGDVYNNIGNLYYLKKNGELAIQYYDKAIAIKLQDKVKFGLASMYNNKGYTLIGMDKISEAIENLETALHLARETSDTRNIIGALTYLAKAHYEKYEDAKAIENCLQALELSKKFNFRKETKGLYEFLFEIYDEKKDYKNALFYHKLYSAYKDSLLGQESKEQLNKLSVQYETERKDKDLIKKDAELEKQTLTANKNSLQRNFFIVGFILMIAIAVISLRAYGIKKQSNKEITKQKAIIEEKNSEIIDSINYARRIQYTLLAHNDFLNQNLPEHFVLFKPKDIVSGDFYWATTKGDNFFIAVCDSTGHGVPGAFMSLLNISFLNEAVNEKNITDPGDVLNFVRQRLIDNISKEGQRDGFDGILLSFNRRTEEIFYSAANNSPVMIRAANNAMPEIHELLSDRMPVGMGEKNEPFTTHRILAKKSESIYLYTDGFADQFGGPKGKKFKYKQLNELLGSISGLPMNEQKQKLESAFENWRGQLEQIDDVCIIGIRL